MPAEPRCPACHSRRLSAHGPLQACQACGWEGVVPVRVRLPRRPHRKREAVAAMAAQDARQAR